MGAVPHIGLWAVAAVAAAVLVVAFVLSREAAVVRRVFFRFFILIAVPMAVFLGGALWLASQVVTVEERIWQAVIAGLFIASGWLTTAIFGELARSRDKAERLRDTHKALYAEIGNTLETLWQGDGDGDAVLARMRGDADFVPFVPAERHDHIYDAVTTRLEVLPRQTIDPIVGYYSQIKSVQAMAEDMRGERYLALPQDRRVPMYEDYLRMRLQAFEFGKLALTLIKAYSEGGASAAERKLVNIQAAARSDRSRGSA
ncbi:hypothetical protein [Pseudooceanicola aestuarii]|uniref:hypothetical protein n=1 Tax=Pseudooceanicola aestuarii TaxID=2697319 RepID=UPI0013D58616|nr:hypothetical protein [Pseudooceanicola aestuarii]